MKMRTQNAYLALAGSLQLVFMATAGTFGSEIFKSEGNAYLIVLAFLIAIAMAIIVTAIYITVFQNIRKSKK